jgi:hypothetical protein
MKKCAYCDSCTSLTREHIWPKSLINKSDGFRTYNKQNNIFHDGEPVIKDVCAECNNIHLSKLDAYLNSLYDSFFHQIIESGKDAYLEYDYNLLLRVLLKISYNSSRAAKNTTIVKVHQKLSNYILNGGYRSGVMLRLQIVTDSIAVNLKDNSERKFKPEFYRCADIPYDGVLAHRFMVRLIAINSYWFYIIIPYKKEADNKWRIFLEGFSNWHIQPGLVVEPKLKKMYIPVHKTTYMHRDLLGSLLNAKKA